MENRWADRNSRTELARTLAREAMVLLKNTDGALPLSPGRKVAFVGQTQLGAIIGGGGSGATHSDSALVIRDELIRAGLVPEPVMDAFYTCLEQKEDPAAAWGSEEFAGLVASGAIYELFGRYSAPDDEPLPDEALFHSSANAADTAILILGRRSGGEECDRHTEGDYTLTASERELLDRCCGAYDTVIAILNVNGPVDMSWAEASPRVKALLLMGTCGEQAAGALADLLTGKVSPCGKLAQTAAASYEAWPSAAHFTFDKDDPRGPLCYDDYGLSAEENGSRGFAYSPVTVYAEDVYVGYRYFDSFEKPVLYPFGFGLSYASFEWKVRKTELTGGVFTLEAEVRNTSERFSGREALQLYAHAPFGKLAKPYRELRAVAKTKDLAPGETGVVKLSFALRDLASFDEESMGYILEAGTYTLLLGNSSRNTRPAARLRAERTITIRRVTADIGILPCNRDKVRLLSPEKELPVPEADVPEYPIGEGDVRTEPRSVKTTDRRPASGPFLLNDVKTGRVSIEEFVAQLSVPELAVLCCGYGTGLPFMGMGKTAPMSIQYEDGGDIGKNSHPHALPGYCSPALERYGICSAWYKDGPAGVGLTAWPTGMMLACTFDPELLYEFGAACGFEAETLGVDSWLAPGLNLIRNPLQGRAFEYFSEDPFLCGLYGTAIARGAAENSAVTVCPKHFALNEQETYRRGSSRRNIDAVDSVVSARAARELYLKPFETVLTETRPRTLMTSFNKINGTFAAGNRTLCTRILHEEWGWDGVVITDWGDLDFVVDGADAVEAGNDVIMPGGPPVIEQILRGYEEGRVSLESLRTAAARLLGFVMETEAFRSFENECPGDPVL